jgi:hypothetical protein
MRSKLIFATVIGLLLCSLATVETTELLRLADDTSNDFSLPNVHEKVSSTTVLQSRDRHPKTVQISRWGERPPKVRSQIAGFSYNPKDILHTFCVMKT